MNSTIESPSETSSTITGPSSSVHRLAFHGSGRELFEIFIINLLKTVATLGIYSFWAKTKTRQYLWGHSEFAGDRFGYHGTGKELSLGWLKAGLLFVGLIALQAWLELDSDHSVLGPLLMLVVFAALVGLARIGAMRYKLSRTSWRGARFTFRGRFGDFFGLSLLGPILTVMTLGLLYPIYQTDMRRLLVENTYFGSTAFKFDGRGKDLLPNYIVALLLFIPTLGLSWIWYAAKRRRYYWNHTAFAAARFNCTVTFRGLLNLYSINLLLLLVTLGFALPWTILRARRYDLEHLCLQGQLDLDGMSQKALLMPAAGEELAWFLDAEGLQG